MADSLKDKNRWPLYVTMAANLVILYVAITTGDIISGRWLEVVGHAPGVLPAGLGLVLTGVLNAQLSSEAKARIVFLRWADALPGSQAFSRHAKADPRVDIRSLERVYGPLPRAPKEQNALWYQLYQTVKSDPAVAQSHREFLFSRDYHCLSMMMVPVLGTAGYMKIPSTESALLYLAFLVVQFLLTGRAARNHGRRFVTTVLAIKACT